MRRLPALGEQEAAQPGAEDAAEPSYAQCPTHAGGAHARGVFRGGQSVRSQLTADDTDAHDEDRSQQRKVGQMAQRNRGNNDDAARKADG